MYLKRVMGKFLIWVCGGNRRCVYWKNGANINDNSELLKQAESSKSWCSMLMSASSMNFCSLFQ